jgi:autoinducer 2 (AI-2) kinase
MEYIIVFDFGTGSGKCVLFDIYGSEVGKKTVKWDYSACPYGTPSGKTFPANIFCEKLFQLVNPTLKENNIQKTDIIAVAAVSQREGMVFLDSNENVIYSGPNIDMRGSLVTQLLKESSDEVKNITGLSIHGMYGLARLLWFKEYKPDIFHNIHKILMINDWLTYCLCGVFVSERSIASSSQLFDIKTGKWAYSLLDRFDISNESLPKIIPAASVAGYLNKQIAQLTGLREGIPVFSVGGDTQSALIGMGSIETNKLCIIAGSTAPVILTVDSPKLFPYLTTSPHIIDNIWCLEANAGQTGTSLRWVIKNFDNSDIFTYDFLQEKAAASPIGSNGICSYLGTMIPGEKLNENLGGFIFPIPWDIDDLSIKDICRSSIESAIF